ncbi:MAG: DUF5694 domain-containing protein [Candidatus Pedobacter colombiensis]|uniref:DUF5694 domain-containing protein n=1 Tax=Candidatus Pedobacter colombiensis TaxID=3121371 RepID=A0AAJ5W5W9_9SPHI|nr:DUF5694 domain-containing protein [Pedobacter sp.]WEK18155.1 MAG: DUF5694 domain-containing protein [Pedobacter sp.]
MKKRIILFFSFLVLHLSAFAQTKKINVYLLGTFHFNQVDTLTYDVNDEKHQESIKQLATKVVNLKPDKVFVERMPEWEYKNKMDSSYQEYRKGNLRKLRNEIWQVGARIAVALNHPHIFQCDHPGMYGVYYQKLVNYAKAHNEQDKLAKKNGLGMTIPLTTLMKSDSVRKSVDLLEYLRWLNSARVQQTSHAHYINVYPQIGNTNVFSNESDYFLGADLTIDWYRRNILIYSKILAQLDYKENAIFLIIGNDHISIIKQLFKDNPYFNVVETEKWLGRTKVKEKG